MNSAFIQELHSEVVKRQKAKKIKLELSDNLLENLLKNLSKEAQKQ